MFGLFDEGGDGMVSEEDMQRAFDLLKVELIPRDLKALFMGRPKKVPTLDPLSSPQSEPRTALIFPLTKGAFYGQEVRLV